MTSLNDKIVIVGAGCFGASTAYHLLKRGHTDVTILDRSDKIPAPDAASNDFNRIVRSSYLDPFYSKLAREAILAWKNKEEWGDTYHETGVVVLGTLDSEKGHYYVDESYRNDLAIGAAVRSLASPDAIRTTLSPKFNAELFDQRTGYINYDGGWADASQGLSMMISKVVSLNGKVLPGKCVKSLIRQNDKTTGVECTDGTVYNASLVILAVGSWTSSSFPDLGLEHKCLATGQCVAMIQLTDDEVEAYKTCPVVLDFSTGFYVFPPNERGIVKMATHLSGYTHTVKGISTPRTVTTNLDSGLLIPKANLQSLRQALRGVYPELAEKPFTGTRLCWYNDSPDGNWIIDRCGTDTSLMLATAGSGHAYKFLPVIGGLVVDVIQGALESSLVDKFAFNRQCTGLDESRWGTTTELDLDYLCTPADLLP